jgi:crotonobetainyl-CoA:carnitine CoA-transferase CaiB-like acyl-CoA transferase
VNYIGYAGLLSIIGEEGRRPVVPGVQIGDLAGGGMAAVIAILAALHKRASTGRGSFCDVSMMDGVVSWLSIHAAEFVATGGVPERERMHLSGAYPCYRVYPASDGWISVGALEPQFWAELCNAIERPDLLDDAFAVGPRRDEAIGELEALFQTRTRAQWMKVFDGKDVCVGPVNDFAETVADEQVRSRAMVVEEALAGVGEWSHVGNPFKFDDDTDRSLVRLPPPTLGEHTGDVLSEIGVSEADIAEMRAAGTV